jgi:hypothetical protein
MNSPDNYEERYCLFLDILGFQSHVDESTSPRADNKKPMNFLKLRSVLNRISKSVNYKEKMEVAGEMKPTSRCVTQFSDSVVISYRKNEQPGFGVSSLLWDVHRIQLDLIHSGVLLRGAIVSGLLFHDDHLVFGPALNEAVALEKLANYPRVILDGQILDEVGLKNSKRSAKAMEYSRSISSMVTGDFDGLCYVDYFNVHPDDFHGDWNELREYLESLRTLVKGLANKKSPSLKVKHSWLRTKFNDMIEPLAKSSFREIAGHSVPDDDLDLFGQLKPF